MTTANIKPIGSVVCDLTMDESAVAENRAKALKGQPIGRSKTFRKAQEFAMSQELESRLRIAQACK